MENYENQKKVVLSARIDAGDAAAVRDIAKQQGVEVTEVLRKFIKYVLKQIEYEPERTE